MLSRENFENEAVGRGGAAASETGGRARRGTATTHERALVDEAVRAVASGGGAGGLPQRLRGRLADGLVDELLAESREAGQQVFGAGGLLGELTSRLVQRAMAVELTEHLGYEPHAEPPGGAGNTRNGTTPKTLLTDHGPVRIDAPRGP